MSETLTTYLEQIFGTYQPIITYDSFNEVKDVSINWGYICAVVIFCIVLWAVLKCVGGIIRAICSK